MSIFNFIFGFLRGVKNRIELYSYRRNIPEMVERIRAKDKIKVLFVLSDLSLWKTEGLYRAMLNHPRFEPIIGLTLLTCDLPSEVIRKYNKIKEYLDDRKYAFIELDYRIIVTIKPDITFYQQPYGGFVSDTVAFPQIVKNNGLLCDIHYSFRTLSVAKKNNWIVDLSLFRYCWQMYVENEMNLEYGKLSILKGKNLVVTGVPCQDELVKPKELFNDPWKPQEKRKKRIIYAPHHTLPDSNNLLNLSCFLDVCDYMFEIAKTFSDDVQFAFKPHPFLKSKLTNLWGEEKTNRYYLQWDELSNCQLVEDSYIDLFKHSDALVHDCDSFTIEYCFIKKPILYLISPERIDERRNDLNQFGKKAFDLHTYGFSKEDIYSFVSSVVRGEDNKKDDREDFYQSALMPPNGRSAVDNIIASILGEGV